jgi:hypothetical protein
VDRAGVLAAFGAIVITGAMATVASALMAGPLAVMGGSLSEGQAQLLWTMSATGNLAVGVMAGGALGIFGWVMMRMKGMWKVSGWLGLLAFVVAAANLGMTWAGQSGGQYALLGLGTLLVFLLWSAATGLVMLSVKGLPEAV